MEQEPKIEEIEPFPLEQEPITEGILSVQEKIIDSLVSQIEKVARGILERVAKGDINAESGKEELIAEVDNLLDEPFKHKK